MEPWLENFARANFQRSADTAHDLKTPLNVAVLNLELLRMRLRKLVDGDEKLDGYARAIETELRRMGRIFDTFFLLSTPPRNEDALAQVDLVAVCAEAAGAYGFTIAQPREACVTEGHEARIRQAFKLFFEGASKLFDESRTAEAARDERGYHVTIAGRTVPSELELTRLFKFYYSDAEGNPDLSLAVARLIAETYGGELNATANDRDSVSLRLSFPLGAQ